MTGANQLFYRRPIVRSSAHWGLSGAEPAAGSRAYWQPRWPPLHRSAGHRPRWEDNPPLQVQSGAGEREGTKADLRPPRTNSELRFCAHGCRRILRIWGNSGESRLGRTGLSNYGFQDYQVGVFALG